MSEKITDGGPAFPSDDCSYDAGFVRVDIPASQGMSLRDWFAGMALQGVVSATNYNSETYDAHIVRSAACAYHIADAMLAERQKANP